MEPEVRRWTDGDAERSLLVWRLPAPRVVIASAPLGGGIGLRNWLLNTQVARGYDRDDPAEHLAELARDVGLTGPGTAFMTAVDVATVTTADDGEVQAWATVGIDRPSWAAAPDEVAWRAPVPGTVNIVVDVPVRLSDAALVNAVATATEAKAQAMADAGLAGTGTPTDAIAVVCPPDGPTEPYGGPRSRWGARLARAVHRAVLTGIPA
jgi:adenosylcobinamide hydrolase